MPIRRSRVVLSLALVLGSACRAESSTSPEPLGSVPLAKAAGPSGPVAQASEDPSSPDAPSPEASATEDPPATGPPAAEPSSEEASDASPPAAASGGASGSPSPVADPDPPEPVIPDPVVVTRKGKWRSVRAPEGYWRTNPPPKGVAVGRRMVAFEPMRGLLASYDPCRGTWRSHEPTTRGGSPIIPIDATHAYGLSDRHIAGVIVDTTRKDTTVVAPRPETPIPRLVYRPVRGGLLVRPSQRVDTNSGEWTIIEVDDATAATQRDVHLATASNKDVVIQWGATPVANDGSPRPIGVRFDARSNRWTPMGSEGAPSPRSAAIALWTGKEFFIYGGGGRTDGGLYDPKTERWRLISGGPVLKGDLIDRPGNVHRGSRGGLLSGRTVVVWDRKRIAAYDLSTGQWHELAFPIDTHERVSGSGRLVLLDSEWAYVLEPQRRRWKRYALPKSIRSKHQRVEVLTSSHLVLWAGRSHIRSKSKSKSKVKPPVGAGYDPPNPKKSHDDGVALRLGSCG